MGKHMNTLHDVMEAWHDLDVDGVLAHLHDEFVWNNSGGMRATIDGKDAMRAVLTEMAKKTANNRWQLSSRRTTCLIRPWPAIRLGAAQRRFSLIF